MRRARQDGTTDPVNVVVDLPAVRPGRLAERVRPEELADHVRELRELLRGTRQDPLADGIRLLLRLDVESIARLADLVRGAADALPFWGFRLLADPPECRLEVTGTARAGDLARAVFGEVAR